MRRPASLMIAIMPHGERDEDNLNREGHDDDGDNPAVEATIGSILRALHVGHAAAVRDMRKLAAALEDMADTYMERNHETLEEAASIARDNGCFAATSGRSAATFRRDCKGGKQRYQGSPCRDGTRRSFAASSSKPSTIGS
jgi:hypothetical protein